MATKLRPAVVLAAGALALAPTGCGGSSDQTQVRGTLKAYFGAVVRGDGRGACARLSRSGRRDLLRSVAGAQTCEQAVAQYRAGLTPAQRAQLRAVRVERVAVEGDRATAYVSGVAGVRSGSLEREGGSWKVAARR